MVLLVALALVIGLGPRGALFGQDIAKTKTAADQGDSGAQYNLGVIYYHGQGVRQDYDEAVKWFRKAADQGHASAQFNLGVMYEKGQGIPQDHGEAAKWFRKAADQGDASTQFILGVMYWMGQGIPQDYLQAYVWLNLAAAALKSPANEAAAEARDAVAAKLTKSQVERGQRLASEWKPK